MLVYTVDDVIKSLNSLIKIRPEEIKKLLTYEVPIKIHGQDQMDHNHPCQLCHAPICSETADNWKDNVISVHRLLHYLGIHIAPDATEAFNNDELIKRASDSWLAMGREQENVDVEVDPNELPEAILVGGDPDDEVEG